MNSYKCTDNKNYALTVGKEYTSTQVTDEFLYITNDNDNEVRYSLELFTKVTPQKTLEEILDSIKYNNQIPYLIFINVLDQEIKLDINLFNETSGISCGIIEVTGINSVLDDITETIENQYGFQPLGKDGIQYLSKEVLKKAILSYLENLQAGIAIMSTNVTGDIEYEKYFYDAIGEIADFQTNITPNPNSGNDIMMWGFYIGQ